jgi:UDP-glucose 4-epimerase
MCKALSERITTSQFQNLGHCRFLATRYGNVLESRGSIIPLFKYQAETSDYLTVTDPNMTRYVMTLDEAVDLIQHTFTYGKSGETWIPILPAMRIGDLAQIFAEQYDMKIKIVGLRPGEKLHEDLINESESTRTRDNRDYYLAGDLNRSLNSNHYVIGPAISPSCYERFTYSSNQCVMSKFDLKQKLTDLGIIDMRSDDFEGLTIEEIRK